MIILNAKTTPRPIMVFDSLTQCAAVLPRMYRLGFTWGSANTIEKAIEYIYDGVPVRNDYRVLDMEGSKRFTFYPLIHFPFNTRVRVNSPEHYVSYLRNVLKLT